MYNRYIPQPDGTYRRRAVPDPSRPVPPREEPQPLPFCPEPPPEESCPPPPQPRREPKRNRSGNRQESTGVGSFLRQLLPKDFDTSDLIIVLLLLLMAGDCPEDQNNALLTLAIYLLL